MILLIRQKLIVFATLLFTVALLSSCDDGEDTVISTNGKSTILTPDDLTDSTFTLKFTTVTGATGYEVDIATSDDFSSFFSDFNAKSVSASGIPITGLTAETDYYVRVRPVFGSEVGGNSIVKNVKTRAKDFDLSTLKGAANGRYVGTIMSNSFLNNYDHDSGNQTRIVKEHFNILVLENAMKMDALIGNRPADPFDIKVSDINTGNIDKFVNYAQANNLRTRGHAMIWFSQAPGWLVSEAKGWTAQQVYDFSESYIKALGGYTKGKIDEWDVLNEAINISSSGWRGGTWYANVAGGEANGAPSSYTTYIESLFKWAREADPEAKLYYNDFSIGDFNSSSSSKNAFMRTEFKKMKENGAPIDAIGFQAHIILSPSDDNSAQADRFSQSIADLGKAGIDVALTELDVRMCDGNGNFDDQKGAYRNMVKACFSNANCTAILVWGITDGSSWIPSSFPGCDNALLFDRSYEEKPAFDGFLEALKAL